VICSSFTFVASANPILYTGAEPVFVDVEYVTWNMDPKLLEQALATLARGGRPCRAVIIPHIYGMPGKIKELMEICAYYKVPVIEDAAQAFGAQYNNKPVGSFGDIAVFSFNNNKIFSLMGGGLIVSNDKKILNRTKYFATQAKKNGSYYLHEDVGFNYKISPILASIGCCLWKSWPLYVEGRRRVFNSYYQRMNRWPLIQFQNEPSGHVSNRWLTVIILNWDMPIDVLPNLLYKLQEENIETRRLWKPLPEQPLFNGTRFFSNGNSRRLFETGVCLPSSASLRNSQIERICTLVEKYLF
jgi:pyridoxal phosphate-dependent aminotransferase EpsN